MQETKKQKSTERFMELLAVFRQWFTDEDMEVSDFVLGRMASRLQQWEKLAVQQAVAQAKREEYNRGFYDGVKSQQDIIEKEWKEQVKDEAKYLPKEPKEECQCVCHYTVQSLMIEKPPRFRKGCSHCK